MKKVILVFQFVPVMAFCSIIALYGHDSGQISSPAKTGDIVITEIMADPVPAVELPSEEYIEIFNRSEKAINLKNWKLSSVDQNSFFPAVVISPGEYLILTAVTDTSLFTSYGRTVGLKPFPALTDKGRIIVLSDEQGNLISGVEYSSAWYGSTLKSGGGWSIEMIDTDFPFFAEGNWEASSSRKGGTPGSKNSSVRSNPDNSFSGIVNVFPKDSIRIFIEFSEPVPEFTTYISGITLDESGISAAGLSDPLFRRFILTPGNHLEKGEVYTICLPESVADFAGNSASLRCFSFGLPESAGKNDLVFNELLFNPLPECPDYIEFFNKSEKVLDATEFLIVSINSDTGMPSEAKQFSNEQRCIIPGAYYAITSDREKVISGYTSSVPENIFNVSYLPSMPDDRGRLLLLNRYLDKIDEVIYTEKMHYSLLSGNEGISLEKIRPDLPSDESISWHSASESSGWGTPGAQNSVFSREEPADEKLVFSSQKISPDNDGYEDVLVIDINTGDPGSTITVTLFDETGSYIKRIVENYLAGDRAAIVWDGTAEDGSPVRTGIYIVLTEMYNASGKTEKWKKVIAVVRR